MFVTLFKNGKEECKSVHRIVAETFLENKYDNFVINHIDGNKINNRVENLEWCSQAYNIRNAFETGLNKPKTKGEHHLSRKVKQYDVYNNYIKTWDCIKDIQQELGFKSSNISACCRSEMKSAYGYKWKYVEYIEIDKIRDKIEELENSEHEKLSEKYYFDYQCNLYDFIAGVKKGLKELLGE